MIGNHGQPQMSNFHLLGKRKSCANGLQTSKKFGNLFSFRQELATLMGEKNKANILSSLAPA